MKVILFRFLVLIFISLSHLNAQWQTDIRLTNDPEISKTSYNNASCIASNGSFVHIVWYDYRDGNVEIYYKRSTNNGLSWGADIRLTNALSFSWSPSVSVSGNIIHVTWFDSRDGNDEIYYKRSSDNGSTWGSDVRLTNNIYISTNPSITSSNSFVFIVWEDTRDENSGEIYCKKSSDGGLTWGNDVRLTNSAGFSFAPSISFFNQNVHVCWYDTRDGNSEIYNKNSYDLGLTWDIDKRLTINTSSSSRPVIAAYSETVHVLWEDERDGNFEIYYKRSTNSGLNWSSDTRLTNSSFVSLFPSICVSNQNLHIVWQDTRDGNDEIYYKKSINGGLNWESDIRLTNNTAESWNPSISVSGTLINIVWYDDRDGNFEIYYKQDTLGNPNGLININFEIPDKFSLSQNYPNPFNPATKIKFDIPAAVETTRGVVSLKIHDILGREVAVLVNEQLTPGTYEVDWDASAFPSGIYFYTINSGSFKETRKMVLLR